MIYVLLILLMFQIIDVYTTYCLINLGANEINFIVLFLMKQFGNITGLIILKFFFMTLLFIFVPIMWHKQWVKISLYIVNIFYFIICFMNIWVLLIPPRLHMF